MIEHLFPDEAQLIEALAGQIGRRLKQGVEARGQASLVAAGGSTPRRLYDALSQIDCAWDKVWVTPSDERWVATDDHHSNQNMLHHRLFKGAAAKTHFAPLKTDDATPLEAEASIDARIAAMPRPFDVVCLGMGSDGHFASLFPFNAALERGLDAGTAANVVAVDAADAEGSSARLSLTLSALLDARWICVLIRGDQKLGVIRSAAQADPLLTPIQALIAQDRVPVDVYWAP